MKGKPKYKIDNARLTRLVAKAQKGNQKATEEVVNMISGYIYYYSLRLFGDTDRARDAVQDILLTMLKKLDTLQDPQSFLGWIKVITANYCSSKITRSHDALSLDDGFEQFEDDSDQINPQRSAETGEIRELVRGAVDALPVTQRESVMMFYFQQLSIRQIAEALSVSENTVKSRLYSARLAMKKHLEKCGAAALASCAVPPLKLISHSLIIDSEQKKGIFIPFASPDGCVMVASVNAGAPASAVAVKAAAIGCACLMAAGGIGAAGLSGAFSGGAKTDNQPSTSAAHRSAGVVREAKPTEPTVPETTSKAFVPTVAARQSAVPAPTQPVTAVVQNNTQPRNNPATEPAEAAVQAPAAAPAPAPTRPPEQPQTTVAARNAVLYLDIGDNWGDFTKIYCHIYEKDGDSFYNYASNSEVCELVSGSVYAYRLDKLDIKSGADYAVVFGANNGASTTELDFSAADFERTVYLTGETTSPGLRDGYQKTYYINWKN